MRPNRVSPTLHGHELKLDLQWCRSFRRAGTGVGTLRTLATPCPLGALYMATGAADPQQMTAGGLRTRPSAQNRPTVSSSVQPTSATRTARAPNHLAVLFRCRVEFDLQLAYTCPKPSAAGVRFHLRSRVAARPVGRASVPPSCFSLSMHPMTGRSRVDTTAPH